MSPLVANIILSIIVIVITIYILHLIFKSPFHYPYFNYYFDVSRKRNPQIEDSIDNFLIEQQILLIFSHKEEIEYWKLECQKRIDRSIMKKYRTKQYQECLDDKRAFKFHHVRQQTRYKQVNYVKSSYKVEQVVDTFSCDYIYLLNRNEELKSINYECTLSNYHSKNQRKLMTKELRKEIMIRDNYTCQFCRKYMPDEVGLHVDHIIPVSKGGKSLPSNLQVLCSKCNGSKSNKRIS